MATTAQTKTQQYKKIAFVLIVLLALGAGYYYFSKKNKKQLKEPLLDKGPIKNTTKVKGNPTAPKTQSTAPSKELVAPIAQKS